MNSINNSNNNSKNRNLVNEIENINRDKMKLIKKYNRNLKN